MSNDNAPSRRARSNSDASIALHTPRPSANLKIRFREDMKPEHKTLNDRVKAAFGRLGRSSYLAWIPQHMDWASLKPVIRCSATAWVGLTFLLNSKTNRVMGQTSYFVLIAAFLSPTNMPFAGVVEKEFLNIACVALASAWSALGIKLASLGRREFVDNLSSSDVIDGRFLEPLPTVACGILLFFGVAFFGYIRSRLGPGPYTVATIVGSLQLIIALAYAPLYPYPNYHLIILILLPISIHAGVSIICSLLIFPQSINAQFIKRLTTALEPLEGALRTQPVVFKESPYSKAFDLTEFNTCLQDSEAGLMPLAASARLMRRDVSYGRFNGEDLKELHNVARQLFIRAEGMSFYFKLLDPLREKFPETPGGSTMDSPFVTPIPTRPSTPVASPTSPHLSPLAQSVTVRPPSIVASSASSPPSILSKRRKPMSVHIHFPHFKHGLFGEFGHTHENPVGIVESLKYMNLESRFEHPMRNVLVEESVDLLHDACEDLWQATADGLHVGLEWLRNVNAARLQLPWSNHEQSRLESLSNLRAARTRLEGVLEAFRNDQRLLVLHPYRPHIGSTSSMPPHRFLFQAFVYQFHLNEFASVLCQLLKDLEHLDEARLMHRVWLPSIPWISVIKSLSNNWEVTDDTEKHGEEDPDMIPGIQSGPHFDLGEQHPRNPDAYPPTSVVQHIGATVFDGFQALVRGNCLYAIKAGLLTVLLILPTYFTTSAHIAYINRSVWAVFLGQINLSRFRGDTTYGLIIRLGATVVGGLVGALLWYISAGNGNGNPFSLAATCAVYFPMGFFLLMWSPLSAATNVIYCTTVALVVSISWQDRHSGLQGSPGYGLDVAWRRMVLVAIGLTAAFLFSFLPPSTSIRGYQRRSHATTTLEIGAIYCSIVSLANSQDPVHSDAGSIVIRLTALRAKLKRVHAMTSNIKYEISIHGEWPSERYEALYHLQLEISALLSQLLSAVKHLEPNWASAFLQRTRFLDVEFVADILASLTMISTALRTASPLPQITPVLLEQFLRAQQGLEILQHHAEADSGLPRSLTIETLEQEQYMYFCVGVSSANAIITRIDRLMLATKELVGEHYFIHGLEVPLFPSRH